MKRAFILGIIFFLAILFLFLSTYPFTAGITGNIARNFYYNSEEITSDNGIIITGQEYYELKRGDKILAEINVINTGKEKLERCKLNFAGINSRWAESSNIEDIFPGEKESYPIIIDVPFNAEDGEQTIRYSLSCDGEGKDGYIIIKVAGSQIVTGFSIAEDRSGGSFMVLLVFIGSLLVLFISFRFISKKKERENVHVRHIRINLDNGNL